MEQYSDDEFRDIVKSKNTDYVVILIGDAGTGKTNIIYSFTR